MPELPEVETMRRGIVAIRGQRVRQVERTKCRLKPILISPGIDRMNTRLRGRTVTALERLGKRVVIRFDSEDALVLEPRMTGLVLRADPPNQEHLRWAMHFEKGRVPSIWYWDRRGLGSVRLFTKDELVEAYGPDRLGPDALGMTAEQFQQQLGRSQREVKVALLDQTKVAGIGNLYASEILHVAGLHPAKRCDRMNTAMWTAVAKATNEVLSEAIKYEGSTLGDGTYRNALNKTGGYQNQHRVYMRAGESCPTCLRGTIQKSVQAQRSTFFCNKCQKKSAPRR